MEVLVEPWIAQAATWVYGYLPSGWFGNLLVLFLTGLPTLVSNILTAVSPSVANNKVVQTFINILDFFSVNIGKNKNADKVAAGK